MVAPPLDPPAARLAAGRHSTSSAPIRAVPRPSDPSVTVATSIRAMQDRCRRRATPVRGQETERITCTGQVPPRSGVRPSEWAKFRRFVVCYRMAFVWYRGTGREQDDGKRERKVHLERKSDDDDPLAPRLPRARRYQCARAVGKDVPAARRDLRPPL